MEERKTIEGYDGRYEVSSHGRIRSVSMFLGNHIYHGKVLSPTIATNGYLKVNLILRGKKKTCLVHRLVTKAFIENRKNLPQVNHKDEIKTNNNVDNLEWCSESYNCNYGKRNFLLIEKTRKPVLQLSVDGNLINRFEVLNDASRITGINAAHICDVCKGKRKLAGGYVWKYATSNV